MSFFFTAIMVIINHTDDKDVTASGFCPQAVQMCSTSDCIKLSLDLM